MGRSQFPNRISTENLLTCILCMSQQTVYFYFRRLTKRKDVQLYVPPTESTSATRTQFCAHKMECETQAKQVWISMIFCMVLVVSPTPRKSALSSQSRYQTLGA